jgi:hypothetical protein
MSPSVGNFVTDLVEMAKATERLPLVEQELEVAKATAEAMRVTVQTLELRAIDRKEEIDRLHARIRELEVSRDDAELRFLELDEKATIVTRRLGAIMSSFEDARLEVSTAIGFLSPPKPEPQPEPVAEVVQSIIEVEAPKPEPVYVQEWQMDHTQGQSVADPIATDPSVGTQSQSVSSETVQPKVDASPSPERGKYSGLRYYDHQYYVPLSSWLAGGGTEEDYHWRPDYGDKTNVAVG